jgi:hypothetical protein
MEGEREYIDSDRLRKLFCAIVARAVADYRGGHAGYAAQAGAWLDETVGSTRWRDVLPVRDGGRVAGR